MMKIDKKTIQKRRMMGYFIDAAKQIMDDRGIEALSAREVADIAGYNGATLYNYFNDLDHLAFYASLRYLRDYIVDLKAYVKNTNTPIERYFKVWACFSYHAFKKPKIFNAIFFEKHSTRLNYDIKEYYAMFPEELEDQEEDIKPMLLGQNILERNLTLLEPCIKKGYVKSADAKDINEMIILIFQSMLTRFIKEQVDYTAEEAQERTLFYMKQVFISFGVEV